MLLPRRPRRADVLEAAGGRWKRHHSGSPDCWNLDALRRFNDGQDFPYNVTHGGWLRNVRDLTTSSFEQPLREAKTLDPKQRLSLEVAYKAFEDANLASISSTSCSRVSSSAPPRASLMRFYNRMEIGTAPRPLRGASNDCSFTAGRISAMLGLYGLNQRQHPVPPHRRRTHGLSRHPKRRMRHRGSRWRRHHREPRAQPHDEPVRRACAR